MEVDIGVTLHVGAIEERFIFRAPAQTTDQAAVSGHLFGAKPVKVGDENFIFIGVRIDAVGDLAIEDGVLAGQNFEDIACQRMGLGTRGAVFIGAVEVLNAAGLVGQPAGDVLRAGAMDQIGGGILRDDVAAADLQVKPEDAQGFRAEAPLDMDREGAVGESRHPVNVELSGGLSPQGETKGGV